GRFPAEFSSVVQSRTAGNPWFLVELARFLKDTGFVEQQEGGWRLARPVEDLKDVVPESMRAMIEARLEQLSDQERRLLQAASVQGVDFDSAAVARALSLDAAEVEESLETLRAARGVVRCMGEMELPDGALTMRYRFERDPDHDALYSSLQPSRRVSLSSA